MSQPSTIQKIEANGLTWVNVTKIGSEEMKYLEKTFNFRPLHLADCFSPLQRPKINLQPDYLFMVLLFPIYHRKNRKIITSELDVFINKNLIVTVHHNELPPLINFFNLCLINEAQRQKYFKDTPALLIYEVLNRLCGYCQPILDDLELAIASIEENIFRGYERRMVRELLVVKSNIINFRQITRVHEAIISQFIHKGEKFLDLEPLKLNFLELVESTGDMWALLENLYQNINTLEQTNNSIISFRLNDIIKILTTISVLTLPVSVVTAIFGMNINYGIFSTTQGTFWFVLIGIVSLSSALVLYFRKKRWL